MKSERKKHLSILVILALTLSFFPILSTTADTSALLNSRVSDVETVYYYDPVSGEVLSTNDYSVLDNSVVSWGSDDGESIVVVKDLDVCIQNRISVIGDVKLILLDGTSLSAQNSITVVSGCSLSIYAGSLSADKIVGTGFLSAFDYYYRGDYGAAIGGFSSSNVSSDAGIVNIYGGNVTAVARYEYNCAIGGAYSHLNPLTLTSGGTVNVYGGSVKAMVINNGKGAGIGGDGGSFNFYGGTVYANGGAEGEEGVYWFSPSDAVGAPVGCSNHGTLNLGRGMTLFKSEDKGITYTPYEGTVERYQYMKIAKLLSLGDTNCDGRITAADAAFVLRFIVGLNELSRQGELNADVNGDLEISAEDAALILRYIVYLIDAFPAEMHN